MLVPTIGIEVHAELKSKSKVFSSSANDFAASTNTNVGLIDLGYPGTLPKLNVEVVDMALKAALAFHCKINRVMHFDRKNYFYPDLPKGYQITQQETPIGYDGYIEIEMDGVTKKIGIERIHIEEDTCKSIHSSVGTLLNFNRAGVPLIEIVSAPDITTPKEAVAYVEKLREILLYLGVSDVKIEEGSMRCDTNISLKEEESAVLGTKIEIKNIGSIHNVLLSLNYEIERQKALLEQHVVLKEETRRFDDKTGTTVLMRVKETGNDYRYFPEPDLPYIELDDAWIERVRQSMPVMPQVLRQNYKQLGLNENHIQTILGNLSLCQFFEQVAYHMNPVIAANLLTGDIISTMNKIGDTFETTKLTRENLGELVSALEQNKISSKQAKELIPILLTDGGSIADQIETLGKEQISDKEALIQLVNQVLEENPESIADFKAGKDRALKYLMGQIMKVSKGQANPALVHQILLETLNHY